MTDGSLPAFRESTLSVDALQRAWTANAAERDSERAGYRANGTLSVDESEFAVRRYRYAKDGTKVLESEQWAPLVAVPLTPEQSLSSLRDYAALLSAASENSEDMTRLLEAALQVAGYSITFLAIDAERDGRPATADTLPDHSLRAIVTQGELNQARSATDDARLALARRAASISKVRKLEEEEVSAALALVRAVYAALYSLTH